jgi:hypothetical protein
MDFKINLTESEVLISSCLHYDPDRHTGRDCGTVINSMPAFSISEPGHLKNRHKVIGVIDT